MAEAKQEQKSAGPKRARVLSRLEHGGKTYLPNGLIEAPASVIDPLEKQGRVDTDKEAVAYAVRQGKSQEA